MSYKCIHAFWTFSCYNRKLWWFFCGFFSLILQTSRPIQSSWYVYRQRKRINGFQRFGAHMFPPMSQHSHSLLLHLCLEILGSYQLYTSKDWLFSFSSFRNSSISVRLNQVCPAPVQGRERKFHVSGYLKRLFDKHIFQVFAWASRQTPKICETLACENRLWTPVEDVCEYWFSDLLLLLSWS